MSYILRGGSFVELLTIYKALPRPVEINLHEPMIILKEIKKIVKDLKSKNPRLKNYRLMDVGFTSECMPRGSGMKLYFIKGSSVTLNK